MKFEKTNWIIFNFDDLHKVADIDAEFDPISLDDDEGDEDLYGVGVECVNGDHSFLVVLDFLVKPNMIQNEHNHLKSTEAVFCRVPFSDSEFKLVEKAGTSMSRIFPDNTEEENLRRIFNVAWTSRCSYPITSYDSKMFNTEASGSEYQSLKHGDIVQVSFKGGKYGKGIFAGVSGKGKETRISVIWIETFSVPTFTETITFFLGAEHPVPHSSIQKLAAA